MSHWKYKLEITNIWINDKPVELKGKAIAATIRHTFPEAWFDWENELYNKDIDQIAEAFENITGYDNVQPVEEFDNLISFCCFSIA